MLLVNRKRGCYVAAKRSIIQRNVEIEFIKKQGGRTCANLNCGKQFFPKTRESLKRYRTRKTCDRKCGYAYTQQRNARRRALMLSATVTDQWSGGEITMPVVCDRHTHY